MKMKMSFLILPLVAMMAVYALTLDTTTPVAVAQASHDWPQEVTELLIEHNQKLSSLKGRVDRQVSSIGNLRTEIRALRKRVIALDEQLELQGVLLEAIPVVSEIVSKNATWTMTWTEQAEGVIVNLDERIDALEALLAAELRFRDMAGDPDWIWKRQFAIAREQHGILQADHFTICYNKNRAQIPRQIRQRQ